MMMKLNTIGAAAALFLFLIRCSQSLLQPPITTSSRSTRRTRTSQRQHRHEHKRRNRDRVIVHGWGGLKTTSSTTASSSSSSTLPPAVPPETLEGITEEACLDTANRMRVVQVPISTEVHPSGEVGISFASWPAEKKINNNLPPIILIHGFDSSSLEYRRLGSRLAALGVDAYAVCLLGWGFGQLDGVTSFSASAKIEALQSFINKVVGENKPYCIAGASLGGAAAIETAAAAAAAAAASTTNNNNCKGLVLLDAQGFVDGIGPMSIMPKPVAKLGVEVLKSVPLRSSANQMSYFDRETFATDEAVVVGRMHCLRDGWNDALVSFMQSGGFSPSTKVPTITSPCLVLWGRQDGILDGEEFANKFIETLPDAKLQWIEECGHVPHLEKPDETASAIASFVQDVATGNRGGDSSLDDPVSKILDVDNKQIIGIVGATLALAGAFAADFLPVH